MAGCAASVRLTHLVRPERLGEEGEARLARVYVLVRGERVSDEGLGSVEELARALAERRDRRLARSLSLQEREALGRSVALVFAQAGAAAAYQTVYEDAPPESLAEFAPSASLWLEPSGLQAGQEEFQVSDSSGVKSSRFRVRGAASIHWRLLAEPGRAVLAEGRVPAVGDGFEQESALKLADLETVLRSQAGERRQELVAALRQALLPHPVQRLRSINKGKGLDRQGFERVKQGDWEGAAGLWRQALAQDPDDRAAHHHLGVYHERAGRWEEARREYELSAQGGFGTKARESRRALAELAAMARPFPPAPGTPPFLGQTLALLPFENESVDVDAPAYVRKKLAVDLEAWGYNLQPLSETDARLRAIGISQGGQLRAAEPAALAQATGAERLLFGDIEEFRTVNVGVYARRQVRLALRLTDASGKVLWSNRSQTLVQTAAKPKDAVKNFLVNLAATQLEKATDDYLHDEADLTVARVCEPLPRYIAPAAP